MFFPPAESAKDDGLLGVGGDDLNPVLIVDAILHGIFPWTFTAEPSGDELDDANSNKNDELGDAYNDKYDVLDEANTDENEDANDWDDNCELDAKESQDPISALSPRCRDARWETFDATSLNSLDEFSNDYIGWWSPNPRAIVDLNDFHVARRLEQTIRSGKFRVSFDEAFPEVVLACATSGERLEEGTWITREFYAGYCQLYEQGFAHSAECWLGDRLVGGVYGVAIGGFFDGESMFSVETNASKVALISLFRRLKARHFQLFDLQILNPHTASFGGKNIPRDEYLFRLAKALTVPTSF